MQSLESDMKLLLDAVQLLNNDKEQQIQALKTLANMCEIKEGAVVMYKNGGIKSITTVFSGTRSCDVKQWALYALSNAVQCYKPNKKLLCIPEMMKRIREILGMKKSTYLVHVAANFILSLASNYQPAQDMARNESCLQKLLEIYRDWQPRSDVWFDGVGTSADELWMIVSSTLCVLMSDPQNEENQVACAKVIPQAICSLKNSRTNVVFTSLNFIGHCISNNKETQRRLRLVGGMHALVTTLKAFSNSDNAENEIKVLALALRTISYAVTDFLTNRNALLKNNGVQRLISILIATDDEETRKIVLFLLRTCLSTTQGEIELSDKDLLSNIVQSYKVSLQSDLPQMFDGRTDCNENSHRGNTSVHTGVASTPYIPGDSTYVRQHGIEKRQLFKLMTNTDNQNDHRADSERQFPLPVKGSGPLDPNLNLDNVDQKEIHSTPRGSAWTVERGNARTNDEIMNILDEHRKLLQSVSKSIDSLKHDTMSVLSHQETPIGSPMQSLINGSQRLTVNVDAMSERNQIQSAIRDFHPNKMGYSYVCAKDKENALLNVLNSRGNCTPVNGNGLPALTQSVERTPSNTKFGVGTDFQFKVPSQSGIVLASDRRVSKKLFSRDENPRVLRRNGLLCDISNTVQNHGVSVRKVASSTYSEMNKALSVSVHKPVGESNVKLPDESWCRGLESTPKSNIRSQSPQRCVKRGNTQRYASMHGGGAANCLGMNENHNEIPGRQDSGIGLPSEMLKVIITPGERRTVQHFDTVSLQSLSTESHNVKTSRQTAALMSGNVKSQNLKSKGRVGNASNTPQRSPLRKKESKCREMESKDYEIDSTAAWVSKSNQHYGLEDDSKNDDTSQCSSIDDTAICVPNVYKTPMPLIPVEDDVMLGSSNQHNQNAKTPADYLPTRLANVGKKVRRLLPFDCGTSSKEYHDNKDKDDTEASSKSFEHAASPSILPPEDTKDKQENPLRGGKGQVAEKRENCLACYPFARFPNFVVNSRNFESSLHKDKNTCEFHRNLIKKSATAMPVKNKIQPKLSDSAIGSGRCTAKDTITAGNVIERKNRMEKTSVFDYMSNSEEENMISDVSSLTTRDSPNSHEPAARRRKRKDYSDKEIENIKLGVKRHGKRWSAIIHSFQFKKGRTAEDLKQKYKRMSRDSRRKHSQQIMQHAIKSAPKPFTVQEIVDLKTGLGRYGTRWGAILNNFEFQKGRTANELKDKYEKVLLKRF
eukprot:gene17975-19771_t